MGHRWDKRQYPMEMMPLQEEEEEDEGEKEEKMSVVLHAVRGATTLRHVYGK